ncbi:MAG: TonB family protein [Candidatus Aminicenantes bacterium]|nr:TonB family protein [Candidatus Aminicenantes bacterium]MDH5714349.1 TonB family protein [Candidatus Aminicenantes bacterium]
MEINQLLEKRKQQQSSSLPMFVLSLILHGVIIISIALLPSFSSPRYSFPKFISANLVDFPSLPGEGGGGAGGGGGEGGLPQGEPSGGESQVEASPPEVKEEKKPELTFSHKDAEAPAPKPEAEPEKQAPKPARQTQPKDITTTQKSSRTGVTGGGNVGAIGGRIGGGSGLGGGGGGGGDLGDLDFISLELAWYQANLTNILQGNWSTSVASPAAEGQVVVVNFTILKDGTITNVEIVQGTGNFALDQAVLRAVLRSSPLPPLPWEIKKDRLIAQYEFVY